MKRKYKLISMVVVMMLLCSNISMNYARAASSIYFAGEYRNTTKKVKYKLLLNKYSSPEGKIVGNYSFKPMTKGYVGWNGELKKIGKNKYKETMPDCALIFKVYKSKVVVKQKGIILRGVNFSGTYKLKKRYPRP